MRRAPPVADAPLRRAATGALVVVDDFLPRATAARMRRELERAPESAWDRADANDDDDAEDVAHAFDASTAVRAVSAFTSVGFEMQRAAEDDARAREDDDDEDWRALVPSFTASRYANGHKIDPHDDAAYAPVELANGGFEMHLRAYAVAYYLTPDDWDVERDGGAFVDMDDETAPGKTIEPKFNRLVVFKVPRVHAVAPVTSENRRRHAIFGWFYRPAREDELPSSDADDASASDASDASESRARKRKRARRERGE